jgi:hypothetical protein
MRLPDDALLTWPDRILAIVALALVAYALVGLFCEVL